MSTTFSVSSVIEKAGNRDKDLRHMALYDLNTELQKENFRIDESSQRQLSEVVLKLLDDTSSEVQGMAVKCLAPLVQKMSKSQIESSMSKLSNNILAGEDEKRDIAKLALKTVVTKIQAEMAQEPIAKSLGPLLEAVHSDKIETKQDALEVLSDILSRFGSILSSSHIQMQLVFVTELASKRPTVRKRAITCLAAISVFTNDKLFEELINKLLSGINESLTENTEDLRTYIQCASAISKTAGYRFGKFLDKFVPLLLKAADNISEDESEDDVREFIMQAFESFIIRCPDEVKNHVELMLILCKEYLEYDPNYNYYSSDEEDQDEIMEGDDDDDAMKDDDGEEEEEEEDGDDDGEEESDDDDISWKVRTAAVKCIGALIKTRPDMADLLFRELCSLEEYPLVSRFKERTESVKLELFKVFNDLLSLATSTSTSPTGDQIVTQHKEISYVKETKPLIIKRLKVQLAIKSPRTRLGVFTVLKKLVVTLHGGLDAYCNMIIGAVISSLSGKDDQNITLKLEVLSFLRLMLKYHDSKAFTKHIEKLSAVIYERVHEKYYKITAESLRVCSELVRIIASQSETAAYDKLVKDIFSNVFEVLVIQDIDQNVKENAIATMGLIIANLGNSKSVVLHKTLPILQDRLDNEVTRLVTCKTFSVIAEAKIEISSVLPKIVDEMSQFLRKSNRPLRQAALITLRKIVESYPNKISADMNKAMLTELERLISDSDLFLAHLSLQLIAQILDSSDQTVAKVKDTVLPRILELLESTTLQGAAMESLLMVLNRLVTTVGFSNLQAAVLERATRSRDETSGQKQIFTNVGKSVAALCQKANDKERQNTIAQFAKNLNSETDQDKMLALFSLGEIGRNVDLSGNEAIQRAIDGFFDSGSEEIKNAASYALGNISVGNLSVFVPRILSEIRSNEKRKYLQMHSLKEVITQSEGDKLRPYVADTVKLLLNNCDEGFEEGIRNVVSECLAKLALVDYDQVMPELKDMLKDSKSVKRAAAVQTASKYVLADQPYVLNESYTKDVLLFLNHLDKSEDIVVRRSSVNLLTSIIRSKPILIREYLDRFLPNLYAECVYNKELVRSIKLGPFTHKIDDGLDLRKSAYECMETIIDVLKDRIDPNKFIAQLPLGLADPNGDIVMLTNLILLKVADTFPEEIMQQMDEFAKPLTNVLKKKVKESAPDQEKERHQELLNSVLRVVYALSKMPGAENSLIFNEILKKVIEVDPALKVPFKAIADADASSGFAAVRM